MCRGMTDLSPDSGSSEGAQVEEEEEPENESIATQYYVGATASSSHAEATTMDEQFREDLDEADGYFSSTNAPGRNIPTPTTGQDQNDGTANENDVEEIENSETESHRKLRYVYSGIEEVSDPFFCQSCITSTVTTMKATQMMEQQWDIDLHFDCAIHFF